MWLVVYPGPRVEGGTTADDWRKLPDEGVQAVARLGPAPVRWTCDGSVIRDRELWTGLDEYDPFGFGPKLGSWLTDSEYLDCWRAACGYHGP